MAGGGVRVNARRASRAVSMSRGDAVTQERRDFPRTELLDEWLQAALALSIEIFLQRHVRHACARFVAAPSSSTDRSGRALLRNVALRMLECFVRGDACPALRTRGMLHIPLIDQLTMPAMDDRVGRAP
jgi:hypothetical protein